VDKLKLLKAVDDVDSYAPTIVKQFTDKFKVSMKNIIEKSFGDEEFLKEQFTGFDDENDYVLRIINDWLSESLI